MTPLEGDRRLNSAMMPVVVPARRICESERGLRENPGICFSMASGRAARRAGRVSRLRAMIRSRICDVDCMLYY